MVNFRADVRYSVNKWKNFLSHIEKKSSSCRKNVLMSDFPQKETPKTAPKIVSGR